jgi:hypothetical protein
MKSRSSLDLAETSHRPAAEAVPASRATAILFADSPRMVAQRQALAKLSTKTLEPASKEAALSDEISEDPLPLPVQRMPKNRGTGRGGRGGKGGNRGGGGGGGGTRGGGGERGGRGGRVPRGGRGGGVGRPIRRPDYEVLKPTIDRIRELKTNDDRDSLSDNMLEQYIQALKISITSREEEDAQRRDPKHARWTKQERKLLRQLVNTQNRR